MPKITRQHLKLVEAAAEIRAEEADKVERAFMARQLVQVTLPHRQPAGSPRVWTRKNGNLTLTITPGWDTKKGEPLPYPAGSIPRLLLYWITTEALRTKSRVLMVGNNLADFMRQLGLDPSTGGGPRSDAARLRQQIEALFRATISLDYDEGDDDKGRKSWVDMKIAAKGNFWWNFKDPDSPSLFGSEVYLTEEFFEAIITAPVPVNMRALRALKSSPMALDLYAWATFKTFMVNRSRKPQRVPWQAMATQLGADYGDLRDFRKKALAALRKVSAVYPGFSWEQTPGGIIVKPGALAIAPKT